MPNKLVTCFVFNVTLTQYPLNLTKGAEFTVDVYATLGNSKSAKATSEPYRFEPLNEIYPVDNI